MANCSKTRINVGHQHDRWMDGSVESSNSCWSLSNISAIVHIVRKLGYAQLMMLVDKLLTHTQKRKYTFYTHVLKVNINFQCKKKAFKKIMKLINIIRLKTKKGGFSQVKYNKWFNTYFSDSAKSLRWNNIR